MLLIYTPQSLDAVLCTAAFIVDLMVVMFCLVPASQNFYRESFYRFYTVGYFDKGVYYVHIVKVLKPR